MNIWIALGLYVLFLGGYWFFVWSIWWHVREYTIPQDQSQYAVWIFFIVVLGLTALSFILFFSLPLSYAPLAIK